mgnify:CR=1 FL=1
MNKVILIGRLTKDTETRTTEKGMTITRFNLAIDRQKEGADFINCIAFDKTAELISKHFKKGNKIALEGHITTGSYEDKEGKKVYTTDIAVERFDFVEKKEEVKEEQKESKLDNKPFEEMGKEVQTEQYKLPF